MSESIEDILSTDLTSIDLSRPVLKAAQGRLKVAKIEAKDTKSGGRKLSIRLTTEDNQESTKGDVVNPGFGLFYDITLTSPGAKAGFAGMRDEKLAKFRHAATGSQAGSFGDPSQYEGAILLGTWKVIERNDGTGEMNEVVKLVHLS